MAAAISPAVERSSAVPCVRDCGLQRNPEYRKPEDLLRLLLLHLLLSEHHFPEHCGDVDLFLTHLDHSFQIEV